MSKQGIEWYKGESYTAAIDMIKASNISYNATQPLVVMTKGRQLISLSKSKATEMQCKDNTSLHNVSCHIDSIEAFYINKDISHLLIHWPYLAKAGKKLLINKEIVPTTDRGHMEKFMNYHNISYEFIDEETRPLCTQFSGENKKILIIDGTIFDPSKGEEAVLNDYKHPNLLLLRTSNQQTPKDAIYDSSGKMVFYYGTKGR